ALVDLHLMTTFDSGTTSRLVPPRRGTAGPVTRWLVLAFTTPELCDLLPRAADAVHSTTHPYLFVLQAPVAGNGEEEIAASLAAELRHVVSDRWPEQDPFTALRELGALGHPVFVLVRQPAGLGPRIAAILARLIPGVTFLVPVTRVKGPASWEADLGGAEVVGPHLSDGWDAFVDAEEGLVDDAAVVRRGLARVHRDTHS
ncbi:MAG: hypothetical protein QOE93_2522, partial [Actinomycetota bacterium]|nr:hypothetical protein [Actinomycetota bacterium]